MLILRQIDEAQTVHGKSIAVTCKEAHLPVEIYYRQRKEYGGLKIDQTRQMTVLECKSARPCPLVTDLSQ